MESRTPAVPGMAGPRDPSAELGVAAAGVGVDADGEETEGVAVARAYRDPADPTRAEVAVVVVDDWQGAGIGRLLLSTLAERCREVGIRRWGACFLGENERAIRLFQSLGSIADRRWSEGVLEMEIEIDSKSRRS